MSRSNSTPGVLRTDSTEAAASRPSNTRCRGKVVAPTRETAPGQPKTNRRAGVGVRLAGWSGLQTDRLDRPHGPETSIPSNAGHQNIAVAPNVGREGGFLRWDLPAVLSF